LDHFTAKGRVVGVSAIGLGIKQGVTNRADKVGVNVGNAAGSKSVYKLVRVMGVGGIPCFIEGSLAGEFAGAGA